jgi:hypothetical protein
VNGAPAFGERREVRPELIARRAVRAAYFGFFVDMFEVYLPIAVLAPALEYFIPAGLNDPARAVLLLYAGPRQIHAL